MIQTIKQLLAANGIHLAAPVLLRDLTVVRPYLLTRAGIADGTAFIFAVPYYTTYCDDTARNISVYAVSRDYHCFFEALFNRILPVLRQTFPKNIFMGFADHSPIAEVDAALKAGLGSLGCHHLFLTKEYASYVFLGEIVTDAVLECHPHPISVCKKCGACRNACPVALQAEHCLSALTQKKGTLHEEETAVLRRHKLIWGCDICQEACPVTREARRAGTIYTKIPFFYENALPHITADMIKDMDEAEFSTRAYAWRKRETILRNLKLSETEDKT